MIVVSIIIIIYYYDLNCFYGSWRGVNFVVEIKLIGRRLIINAVQIQFVTVAHYK